MASKKKDPKTEKEKQVVSKLFFLGLVALLLLATHMLLTFQETNLEDQTQKESQAAEILGEKVSQEEEELKNQFQDQVQDVKKQALDFTTELEQTSEKLIMESKEKVEETTSEFLYSTAFKPIVEKFNTLPDKQREYLQEQLCKPTEEN